MATILEKASEVSKVDLSKEIEAISSALPDFDLVIEADAGYNSAWMDVRLNGNLPKTDAELKAEVARLDAMEKHQKEATKKNRKEAVAREKASLKLLAKKYPRVVKELVS